MSSSEAPRDPGSTSEVGFGQSTRDMIEHVIPHLLGVDACLLHPRANYVDGFGGGDFDYAVDRIDHQWPLRATGIRVCQCIRHSPGGWYWVIETPEDVLAIDALDDPLGMGPINFPTVLAFGNEDSHLPAVRAAFVTMKRLAKRMRKPQEWDPIIEMAQSAPGTYARCLEESLGRWLGGEISRSVLAGQTPSDGAWKRTPFLLRARRIRTPRRAAILFLRSFERLAERLRQPTGLIVAIVGPDGAGKSTLARTLVDSCVVYFWKTKQIHWRPGLLPRLGALIGSRGSDPERPHDSVPHSPIVSIAVLLYYWLDFVLGSWLMLKPLRVRSALVVLERGWWDMFVDPRRYRLQVPESLTALLGRLLPKPDITFVLDAPAPVLLQRKREVPIIELERQADVWRVLARKHRSYALVNTTLPATDVEAVTTEKIVTFLEQRNATRIGPGWLAIPDRRTARWMIPRGSRRAALEGLRVYQPVTPQGRLVWEAARMAATLGVLRFAPRGEAPNRSIRQVLAPHIPPGGTVAIARSSSRARCVALILDGSGVARAVAKVALDHASREALDRESLALGSLGPLLPPPLRAPHVLDYYDGLLLLEAVRWRPRLRPWRLHADVARAIGSFYAAGRTSAGVGPAHGDFAPWNLLETDEDWVAVDWEAGRKDASPFYDLFHFLVQSCALLGRPSQNALLLGLAGEGEVAQLVLAYASGAHLAADDAREHFLTYLRVSRTTLDSAAPKWRAGIQVREDLEQRLRSAL